MRRDAVDHPRRKRSHAVDGPPFESLHPLDCVGKRQPLNRSEVSGAAIGVRGGIRAGVRSPAPCLDEAGLLSNTMALANRMFAAAVLIIAGIYQWTPLKEACLRHCRSPLTFLLFHWREGGLGAFTSGLGHGAYCLGCCWMLMALLFVGGIMNLGWIAAIALIVLIEKTLPWGGWMGRITGVLLVIWGAITLAMAA